MRAMWCYKMKQVTHWAAAEICIGFTCQEMECRREMGFICTRKKYWFFSPMSFFMSICSNWCCTVWTLEAVKNKWTDGSLHDWQWNWCQMIGVKFFAVVTMEELGAS